MKIVQINTVYNSGSTGKITASLYNYAAERNNEAYVAYGRGPLPADLRIQGIRIGNKADFYGHVMINFFTGRNGFASRKCTEKFLHWLDEIHPDIIHLHNLHGFYIHVGLLFDYIKTNNIPVVWTLHDCWSFTGGCAYFDSINCTKWQTQCSNCTIHRTEYPYSLFKDNTYNNYILKQGAFTGVQNMTIVTPSKWLATLVKQSFLKDYAVTVINNGIDTDIFCPQSAANCAKLLSQNGLKNQKILLGVASIWEPRKGLDYMLKLSEKYNTSNGYQIVIIGLSSKQIKAINRKYGNRILCLKRTANQHELAIWYTVATVYINPTLQDNYPTTNLESLACGTPVITFDTGGSPECIDGTNGMVVPKGDYEKLCQAIDRIYMSSAHCKPTFSNIQNQEEAASSYIDLYQNILNH